MVLWGKRVWMERWVCGWSCKWSCGVNGCGWESTSSEFATSLLINQEEQEATSAFFPTSRLCQRKDS